MRKVNYLRRKNEKIINTTLGERAEYVNKYLYNLGMTIGRLAKDKSICKKDRVWVKDCVLSIIKIMDLLYMVEAMNKCFVKKKG